MRAVESVVAGHAALRAAAELGVLDALAGSTPRTPASIAERLGLDERATSVLLDALVELDVVERLPGGCRAHSQLPLLARKMAPGLDRLADRVRTGEPALAGDRPAEAGRLYEDLAGLLGQMFAPVADEVAGLLAAPDLRVLDAGAGAAPWSIAIARHEPTCRVDAVDLPEVIATTRRAVAAAGCEHRFDFVTADVLEDDLPHAAYDLVIAANLCHLFAPSTAARLLDRLARSVRPGGTLAIVDAMADQPEGERRRYVALYETGLLTRTADGRVHPYSAYLSWLEEAGCTEVSRHDCSRFPVSVVRAVVLARRVRTTAARPGSRRLRR